MGDPAVLADDAEQVPARVLTRRVHEYLATLNRREPEQRVHRPRSQRHRYPKIQWIAPYYGTILPARDHFHEVRCQDLSASGLSFYWPCLPDFEHLLVRLGDQQNEVCFVARVARSQPVVQGDGTEYLVGCKFLGRVRL
jgi:hypothetical protein